MPARRSVCRKCTWLAVFVPLMTVTIVLLKGCTATVVAPANVQEPVAVYILVYGRHPSLVLPRSEAELVEYSYGEWEWYALNRKGFFDVFRALFINSPGTLGRREIEKPFVGIEWWVGVLDADVHRVTVERTRAADLLRQLDDQWEASRQTAVYNPLHDLHLVHHPQRYNAFTNSNIKLVKWLEELDCTVRGWPLYPINWRVATE